MAQEVLAFSKRHAGTRKAGSRRRNGLALRTLAWHDLWRGRFAEAEGLAVRAEARLKNAGADDALISALVVLASVCISRLRNNQARTLLADASKVAETSVLRCNLVDLHITRSQLERQTGRLDLAQTSTEQARSVAQSGHEHALIELSAARALIQDGRPAEALEHTAHALELCEHELNQVALPYALQTAATALIELRQIDGTEDLLNKAMQAAKAVEDRRAQCQILHELSRVFCLTDQVEKALETAQQGRDMADAMDYPLWKMRFLERAATFHEQLGQTEAALDNLKALIALRNREHQ